MEKRKISVYTLSIALVLIFLVFLISQESENSFTEQYSSNLLLKAERIAESNFYLSSGKLFISEEETIELDFTLDSKSAISSYTYKSNGAAIVDISVYNHGIKVILSFDQQSRYPLFELIANLSDKTTINGMAYFFNKEGMIFFSNISLSDARNKYYQFAYDNGILSEEEIESDWNNTISEEIIVKKKSTKKTNTNRTIETLYAQLLWEDDNNVSHPLTYTKFDVIDKSGLIPTTNTYYTDSNGYFPEGITVPAPANVDIKIYASGVNTSVCQKSVLGIITPYYYIRSNFDSNVLSCCFPVTMTTDFGKALEISQALIYADKFVTTMREGNRIDPVSAVYPESITDYNSAQKRIRLIRDSSDDDYADWDVIMHEYGHHVSGQLSIDNNPGEAHHYGENLADKYSSKSIGVRLAWGEAWPTVFSEVVQQYYSEALSGITNVADGKYTDIKIPTTDNLEYYYENVEYDIGEACEGDIIGVLWDLYDDGLTEDHDYISLGVINFWTLSVGSHATTLSEFIGYLYSQWSANWTYINQLGNILEHYKVAPYNLSVSTPIDEFSTVPPTYSWSANGTSASFPYNSITIKMYCQDYSISPLVLTPTSSPYTVSSADWQTVMSWAGKTVHAIITCSQTANPITGEYRSHIIDFIKPIYQTSLSSGILTITGTYSPLIGEVVLPPSIGGYPIVVVGAQAFRNQTGLTGITLPSTITTIGNRAFQFCTSLAYADLSATAITRIEDYTFDTCPLGTSLSLPSTLTYIGEGAFIRATGLTSIVLPASVTTINSYAFYSCTNLATVDLSATGVNTISPHCFESCLLDDFYYPPNVMSIGNSAFRYAGGPTNRNIPSGVTIIGDYAFANASDILNYGFPSSLKTIGNYAISNNGSSLIKLDNTSIETIGEGAFANTELVLTSRLPSTLKLIGMNAFYQSGFKNNNLIIDGAEPVENDPDENGLAITSYAFTSCNLEEIRITKNVTYIGILAFNGNSARVTYIEDDTPIDGWEAYWNIGDGSFPVFRECVFSSDYSYIISFEKENGNPQNVTSSTATPTRKNYTFGGWYRESDPNTLYMDVTTAPNDTLRAKWTSSSCIAAGSLITLADGTQVAVENLTGNESLLVWNMLTGQYDTAPILFIDSDPYQAYEVITLTFSDNTQVKVIYEHAFFDMTIGEYVFLRNDAAQYIGHYFNKKYGNTWTTVQLTNVSVGTEYTTAWSPVTYGHLCYYVNGMLTMPGATEGFINIFDVDTTLMQYDAEQMAADIQTYGLYTYEEFNAIIPLPELVFNAFNGQYLKVSIGKGLITLEEIVVLLERYAIFFS